jgi:hypothetical protein
VSRDVRVTAATVQPKPAEPDVTLTMSAEVARTLMALTGKVGGSRSTSYRRDTNEVYDALARAGVRVALGSRFFEGIGAKDVE